MGLEEELKNDIFSEEFDYRKTAKDKLKDLIDYEKKLKKQIKEMKSEYRSLQIESFLDYTKNSVMQAYEVATRNLKKKLVCGLALCVVGGYIYNSALTPTEETKQHDVIEQQASENSQPKTTNEREEKIVSTSENVNKENTVEKTVNKEKSKATSQQQDYKLLSLPSDYIYFVSRGDTLSKISRKVTGDMDNWHHIKAYNSLESNTIEVNQALKIPSRMAKNKEELKDYTLVEKAERFDGKHMPLNYIQADKNDSFREISDKLYNTPGFAKEILSYNLKINPDFSTQIFDDQYIYKPPEGYLNAGKTKK